MNFELNTEATIDNLVANVCGEDATAREKHLFRESLRGLVRLARAEQLVEMKSNVGKATGTLPSLVHSAE